jgi:hypothetical protein
MANRYVDQPQRRVIQTRGGEIVMDWDPRFANHRNDLYNRAQRYVDAQVLYKSEAFIPVRSGLLMQSGRRCTRIGSGEVIWKTAYARPVYYGHRAPRGEAPKGEDGKNKKRPHRIKIAKSSRWFERMKMVSGAQIVDKAKRIAGGTP